MKESKDIQTLRIMMLRSIRFCSSKRHLKRGKSGTLVYVLKYLKMQAYINYYISQRAFLSTALFTGGPWSKQVIRHKEADSVCFDGGEYLTVSLQSQAVYSTLIR